MGNHRLVRTQRAKGSVFGMRRWAVVVVAGILGMIAGITTATATSSSSCVVDYKVLAQWPRGFLGTVSVTNTGAALDDWKLQFDMPDDQQIRIGWLGKFSQDGSTVTIDARSWNAKVRSGATVTPGFIGSYRGANGAPTSFTLNGQACDTGTPPPTTPPPTTAPPTTTPVIPTTAPPTTTPVTVSVPDTTVGTTPSTDPTVTPAPTTSSPTTEPPTTLTPTTAPPVTTAPAPTTAPPTPTTAPAPTTAPPTTAAPPSDTGAAANLRLIKANPTRNTQFDNARFYDVPMNQINVSDLTVNRDIYNEPHIDTTNSGYFRVKCEVSHFAYDDPIVFPNQPGRAHLHMFFGNTNANAYSTFDSLLNSGTGTCNGQDLNRSSYWVPAVLDSDGNALIPEQVMVYYKNDNFTLNGANELVSPFPDNLRMIAGNGKATSPQTQRSGNNDYSLPIISFNCGPAYDGRNEAQALIPDCYGSGNTALEMKIAFPQCFNPSSGTYRSDQSHTSYSEGGYYGAKCPDSHSTDLSSIMYRIFFRPGDYGGALTDLVLSSDVKMDRILPGGTTSHADWFGAWHPEAMGMWVANCNNQRVDCETGMLDRDPAVSMVLRSRGHYPRGYKAPAEELIKLCPGKTFSPSDPLRSVAMCRMG